MNLNETLMWLLVGLVPYYIKRESLKHSEHMLEVRALFWSLLVCRYRNGHYQWTIRIPLILQLRNLLRTVVKRLQEDETPQE